MMQKQHKSIAVVNRASPSNTISGRESLDTVLAMASFEQDVTLFFIGDGVLQLQSQQDLSQVGTKHYLATLKALPFYDVDQIFACSQSLDHAGLTTEDLIDNVQVINPNSIQHQLQRFDVILGF